MLADEFDVVIGVDTHADSHTLVLVDVPLVRSRCSLAVAASRRGYRQALRLARRRAPGRRAWAIEGSGCYGHGLARFLAAHGERVFELERPGRRRQGRRGRLKSDPLDAERAARALLAGEGGAAPRLGEATRALRSLLACREGAVRARTAARNQLRAQLLHAPCELRERLRGLPRARLLAACSALRAGACADPERAACALSLRLLARRVQLLEREARTLERELERRLRTLAPALLGRPGVGPISAATVVCAWSYRGRVRSEAAFARLGGAAPIPASSGKTVRHRLDRGGDRQLNRALHAIVLTLRRHDSETQAYIARRVGEGKSEREAVRLLKRYLARSLFRLLEREAAAQGA
jgi:transposase